MAMGLSDESCPQCGEEELIWWSKDETETIDEVKVDCTACGHNVPKRVVKKSDDTPREQIAREMVN